MILGVPLWLRKPPYLVIYRISKDVELIWIDMVKRGSQALPIQLTGLLTSVYQKLHKWGEKNEWKPRELLSWLVTFVQATWLESLLHTRQIQSPLCTQPNKRTEYNFLTFHDLHGMYKFHPKDLLLAIPSGVHIHLFCITVHIPRSLIRGWNEGMNMSNREVFNFPRFFLLTHVEVLAETKSNSASCNVKLDKYSVGCCKHTHQVATLIPGKKVLECSITDAKWCKWGKKCKMMSNDANSTDNANKAVAQKWDAKIRHAIEKSWQQGFSRAAPCSYSVASNPHGQMASKFKQQIMIEAIEANSSLKFHSHPGMRNVAIRLTCQPQLWTLLSSVWRLGVKF